MIPVMSSLEILVEAIGVTALRLERIRLQHSSYLGLDRSMNWQHAALVIKRSQGEGGDDLSSLVNVSALLDVTVRDCEISHTAMTGLLVSMSSEVMIERNVFTDIGYHGILQNGDQEMENITVANNYLDGSGITRHWSTNGIFSQGSRNVVISNNEVCRTLAGGIMVKSDSMGSDYWTDQAQSE